MTATSAFTDLCPGCFADKGNASICPHCGYDESLKRGPLVLAHRTLLNHGQYLIGKVLGKPGGFGITYLALDTKLETRVAIKEYLPRDLAGRDVSHATVAAHSAEDEEFFRYGLTQFLQEARTLAQFDHANIVRVRNFFEENSTGYLVMDYYDGVTLADYLAQQPQGKLPEKTAVAILMPILDGLREVHAKNFLHRDIKPQNIYLTTGNRPILLDFGAARQAMSERSRSLSVVLSEGYAPYEQYHRRGEQGPWTDIYACAAVLYHAVAGEAPPPATERVHKDELDIAALGLSASLTNALRLGLAVDHHNRPQRMTEFQALLLGDKEPILTSAITPPPKTGLRSSEEESAPEVAPVSTKQTQNQSTSSLAKWAILAALIVGVVITIMIVGVGEQKKVAPSPDVATPTAVPPAPTIAAAPIAAPEDPDTTLWNEAKASGERKRLDAYLKQYPKGKFVELAEIELKKLDERSTAENDRLEAEKKQATEQLKADQLRAEQQVWDQAKADNTPNAYAAYLNSYPKGRFSSLALKAQQIAHEEAAKRERQAAEEAARRELEAKEAEAERVRQESIRKAAEARRPGRSFKDCDECPEMVVIAAGSFQMGSPLTEKSRHSDESPIRTVTISQPFSIGKYEITFDEWLACVRANGCKSAPNPNHSGYGRGRRPVINVSLTDAREYVKWLSSKTGWDYRLPSEAQWEYVARAGSRAAFSFGATIEPSQANFDGRSSYAGSKKSDIYLRQTVPVGQYPANAFGVHDMHGNVSEWVDDCWNPSYENAPSDGSARTDGECDWSILRGGSHNDDADRLRTALRRNVASFGILNRSHFTGFRVVRHGF